MKYRALDQNSDWSFGTGLQSYFTAIAAIRADIQSALQVYLGESFFALDFGIDWWNLIGGKDEQGIILQCRAMISTREGVTKINRVDATLNRTTRALNVSYNIDTVFTRNLSGQVTIA